MIESLLLVFLGIVVGSVAMWTVNLFGEAKFCVRIVQRYDELSDLLIEAEEEITQLRNYISDIEKSHKGVK
jgi:hypothetical protein